MHGPEPVGWLLVALGCGTGGYCLLRLRGVRAWWRQGAAAEGVMGLGMAAMAGVTAPAGLAPLLGAFYAAVTVWWVLLPGAGAGAGHRAHHLAEGAAMVYMALAMAGDGEGRHAHVGGAGGVPWLTGALAAYFALRALRAGRRLVPAAEAAPHGTAASGAAAGGAAGTRPPEVVAACRVALSMGMLAMLLTL
ncbi:DUF5134 domain-containing protein [Streptomyces sp. 6N223]|uniref:DUF5134 domain-containing protein n=1 Tax=Streptomyces sp. 6N223 TaxID=3457412 RepID=UPI003FD1357D